MSINFPSDIEEIFTQLANDTKSLISKSDPFLENSLTKAMLTSFAGRIWDVYQQINALIDESFDDTRTGTFLEREASDYGITRKVATAASGFISAVGTASSIVTDGTEFLYDALVYTVDGDSTITNKVKGVTLSYSSGNVSCVFGEDHGLGNGQSAEIVGASPTGLNGTFVMNVLNATTLTYSTDIVGSGSGISASADYDNAVCSVISDGYGLDYNRNSGEELEIGTSIAGVDSQAVVTYDGISGGADEESDEELRSRLQQRKKEPAAFFNSAQVEAILREISWVDRVFIERVTPSVGEAEIYLVKEENEIPSSVEITEAEEYFEPYLPINCDYTNIFILAPTAQEIPFTFASISPDTTTMRQAIEDNLDAFFLDRTEVGVSISEELYRGIIINTVDPESLEPLASFSLSTPSGDISVSAGYLPTLGTVTFS